MTTDTDKPKDQIDHEQIAKLARFWDQWTLGDCKRMAEAYLDKPVDGDAEVFELFRLRDKLEDDQAADEVDEQIVTLLRKKFSERTAHWRPK